MKKLNPYVKFNGTCREAMTFYRECLGGELTVMTVGESPVAAQLPADTANSVLHSTLTSDSFTLMGTDMTLEPFAACGPVAIAIHCSSEEEIDRIFGHLSADGQIVSPLAPAFWGGRFGVTLDRFGVSWMLNSGDPE